MKSLLPDALAYASTYGWHVHPVNIYKMPPKDSNGFYDATTDEATIREYFKNGAQLSVRTGATSGVFVLDVDIKPEKHIDGRIALAALEAEHGPLPHTPRQRTGSGGEQYFFKHVPGLSCTTSKIGAGIDTRGEGGYAVVAPSRNTKGAYEWIVSPSDAPLAEVPQWVVDALAKDERPQAPAIAPNRDLSPYLERAYRDEIANVVTAPDGQKHDTLRNAAVKLGSLIAHGLDEQLIMDGLYTAISGRAKDPENARRTIQDGIDYGKAHPREIPDRLPPNDASAPIEPAQHATEGEIPVPSEMVMRGLAALGYSFRLNLCDNVIEVNGAPLDDILEAEIITRSWDATIKPKGLIKPAYTTDAAQHAYHPVKDYLTNLVWDGQDRMTALAAHLHSDDAPIVYDDGTRVRLVSVYLKRWLVGAVAKALDRKQNVMLVLAGPQNIGKSAFAKWLCSGIADRFIEGPIRVEDKDSSVRLMSRFIWEVSELDATTRRSDVSALKDFITRDEVTVRKAFGRHDTIKPALASMIGTVNECAGFLSDESGNRRFMVTSLTSIDWAYTRLDVNQLWAQAVAMYRAGEPWRLTAHESKEQAARNQAYDVETALDGWMTKWFDMSAGSREYMTSADIIDHLRRNEIRLGGTERAQAMELSRVLARHGVEKVRTSTWRGYRGVAPRDNPMTTYPTEVVIKNSAPQSHNDNVTTYDNLIPIEEEKHTEYAGAVALETLPDFSTLKENDVIGCHVVIEASGSDKNSDNHNAEVVRQVDTRYRDIARMNAPRPNVNRRREQIEEQEAAEHAARYGPDEDT